MSTIPPPPAASSDPAFPAATVVPWERVERFVGQFTHDVRNGLNALELQLTFLGEISTDPEAAAEVKQLRATLGEVTRQLQAVKLKTGSVSSHSMEYPAADFLEDLRERFERFHQAGAARVRWSSTADRASLLIDPELAIHALLELLGNALHFGVEGGGVEVMASPATAGEGVTVALRQGMPQRPEIPPERWGHEPLLTTKRHAYGLGLFRVRRILEALNSDFAATWNAGVLTLAVTFPSPAPAS